MKWVHGIIFLFILNVTLPSLCAPIITFFFVDYPANPEEAAQLSKQFSNPMTLAEHGLARFSHSNRVAGIFCSYYGYIQASAIDGQISFPRKQSKSELDVYITHRITPVVMFANTISHWELQPGIPAKHYLFTFKEDDSTKKTFWDMQEKPIPEDNIIPAESLIIIAKPETIYVPLGIAITPKDSNLILPNLYVKKGIHATINALYMLNLTQYFRPVDLEYKKSKRRYGEIVNEY